jgi:hypothetical protein
MRIIDFKKLEVETEINYKTVVFSFEFRERLDMSLIPFAKWLSKEMSEQVAAANLDQYKDDSVVFEFRTDLKNMDLDPLIPQLMTSFVLSLNIDKSEYKHGEKILAVPPRMNIDKGLLMDANALDLINYNIPVNRCNFMFFNVKNKAIRSVLAQ